LDATFETLILRRDVPHVGLLTLNRPDVANAINTQMARELLAFFERLAEAPGDTRCVIVTGSGQKAFCAGGDLKERAGMTDEAWLAQHAIIERMTVAVLECPVPVIAALNGAAFGGGLEIALACDFAYAVEGARFALTETSLGIIPGAGGTQTLPRAVGSRRALEIILTAQPFSAEDAQAWGIVNRVVPQAELLPQAIATAQGIAANAPLAVAQAKKSIRIGGELDLTRGLDYSIEAYNRLVPTEDRREGVQAFVEKRKPRFRGR
jgi:enoyl-CoA hydratase